MGRVSVGVEGFVPDRLRDAINLRDRTGKDVAAAIGVSETTISRYLTSSTRPNPQVFVRLAAELELTENYFVRPMAADSGSPLFYRSLAAATKRARARARVRHRWLREAWDYLHQYVEFPTVALPEHQFPKDPASVSFEAIEESAIALRHEWGLGSGPVSNVVRLIERHGGIVSRVNLDSPRLDAFSQWGLPEQRPFFVLNADKRAAVRSRWDAAHELGHMIIHRHVEPVLLRRPEIFKLAEAQAHRFAGAFLLPADSFGRSVYVPALSALLAQKRIWRVSVRAMLRRMVQLRLISPERATPVWQSYSRSGMQRREPLDDEFQPEQPEVLRRACEMTMEERGLSREQLLEVLPFDQIELQGLLGLPLSFLRPTEVSIRWRGGTSKEHRPGPNSGGTPVTPFPGTFRRN